MHLFSKNVGHSRQALGKFPRHGGLRVDLPGWSVPLTLLWISVLSFGLLIPWLGLYADDWPFVYVADTVGARGVIPFISWVRPYAAPLFAFTAWLFGKTFWGYHVFLLLLRWADAVLFWWVLRLVWPRWRALAAWAALAFAFYPAFKQQPLALEYSPHFIVLGFYFISIATMLLAAKKQGNFWLLAGISWLCSWSIFSIEYFVGLELLRPVLLGLVLYPTEPHKRRLVKRVLVGWLPYLLVWVFFLVWRVFILKFPTYQPELVTGLSQNIFSTLVQLVETIVQDVFTVTVGAWVQIFTFPTGLRSLLLYSGVVLVAFVSITFFIWNYARNAEPVQRSGVYEKVAPLLVGLYAVLIAGWPFWITHIPVQLTFPWDRPSLSFMVGVSLLVAGLANLLPRRGWQALFLGLLAALSVGSQFQNANLYRKEWEIFKPFYWQLTWRAPGLKPGTALIMDTSPFAYHVDKFLTPGLNWTYAPDNRSLNTPYNIFDFYKLSGKVIPSKQASAPVNFQYGTLEFHTTTDHLLMIAYDPPGCVRVLSPHEGQHLLISEEFRASLNLSNLEQILPNPPAAAQPPAFFGSEPDHSWCYYFEKADLARQMGEWQTVTRLGDEAFTKSLSAGQPSELLVFVEGYAHAGRWEDARRLSDQVVNSDGFFRAAVCETWKTISKQPGLTSAGQQAVGDANAAYRCGP